MAASATFHWPGTPTWSTTSPRWMVKGMFRAFALAAIHFVCAAKGALPKRVSYWSFSVVA